MTRTVHPRGHRLAAALAGAATIVGGLTMTSGATAVPASGEPTIVLFDPASNLTAKVRDETRRGNDVGRIFRSVGEGFVADLDATDMARLAKDPDVLVIERDRPVHAIGGGVTAGALGAGADPIWEAAAPANDLFADGAVITGASGTVTSTTAGATRETGEPNHGGAGGRASIWYRWTAPSSGTLRVTTEGSGFDTLLGAYTGTSVSALQLQGANDDDVGGLWSTVSIPVISGTTYHLAIDGWGGETGATMLTWTLTAPAPAPTPAPSAGSPGPSRRPAASWGLDRIDQAALPLDGWISTPQNGSGVTAYVIDTGVRSDHADFGGRVRPGFTAIADGTGSEDCNGHGTHVAGTVAGNTYGVAPAAAIVPVRVLDCGGSGSTSGVIAGIDWAIANHQPGAPAVANMSLGGWFSAAMNDAVARGTAAGIAFAVAAGNSSDDACRYSPASEASAITVGATTPVDARSSFSNTGTCLDVFAPGSSIRSAYWTSSTATATLSGTSMASPHVAGAAALLLSATPAATPGAVRDALVAGTTRGIVTDAGPGSPNALLNVASGITPAPPPATDTPATRPAAPAPAPVAPGAPGRRPPRAASVPRTPRLLTAVRTARGVRVRIRGKGAGYQVFINGKVVGRTTSATATIRTKAARRGARVRVRAFTLAGVSALSNPIRL